MCKCMGLFLSFRCEPSPRLSTLPTMACSSGGGAAVPYASILSSAVVRADSSRLPLRVKLDKTQIEHNEFAYPLTAALKRTF